MEQRLKIIVEKHADGYVAYPLGMKGIVLGQGDTYKQALEDVRSAIHFHIDAFGSDLLDGEHHALGAHHQPCISTALSGLPESINSSQEVYLIDTNQDV